MFVKRTETKLALGGDAVIMLVGNNTTEFEELFKKIWVIIFNFERQYSRFIPGSELSKFNRQAGVRTKITPEFRELLEASAAMSSLTNDLHNPFILPALQKSGYVRSAVSGYENDPVDDFRSRKLASPSSLHIESDNFATIPLHTAIDMGGCGKGYLLDVISKMIDTDSLEGYWISLSGDIISWGVDEDAEAWETTIQQSRTDASVPTIVGHGEQLGIATSGTFRRDAHASKTQDWHHIIDPKTGKSSRTDIGLATVVASTAIRADVLASAAVLLGSRDAPAFLRAIPDVFGYCIQTDAEVLQHGEYVRNNQPVTKEVKA